MDPQAGVPAVLCIAGMHRSGTSVVTSLLQSGGLDVGQRLLGAGSGNVKGHFEDLDFFQFHVQVLKAQGLSSTGYTLERGLQIRGHHVVQARALIEERRRRCVAWGWKDPRTTLFLDFWQQMLPEAHFLLLYRCPWDVIDSMFRRGDKGIRANPSFAAQLWVHYNRLLLEFHDRYPQRCLCVSSYRAVQSPLLLREALACKFGLQLGPLAELYDSTLLHRLGSSRRASLVPHHFPESVQLYEQLNDRARQTLLDGDSLAEEGAGSRRAAG